MSEDNEDEGGVQETAQGRGRANWMPPGCILKPTIAAAVALTGGIYLVNRSEKIGGAGRVAAVVLIFFGAILSIPFLLIFFGLIVRWYFHRRLNSALEDVVEPAREMIERNKALFGERHEYRDATEADFEGLDREWYEANTRELEASGHRQLGDVVDQTIAETAGLVTVIRRMVSADGTTLPCLFHFAIRAGGAIAKEFRTIEFESEFSDGTFFVTSNTAESDLTTPPPAIHRDRRPLDTPVGDLLRSHEAQKLTLLVSKAGASLVKVSTAEEAMEFQRRQQVIKAAFRKGIGYVDPEEVRRIAKVTIPDNEAAQAIAVASVEVARRGER